MAGSQRRWRMVSFRLPAAEYNQTLAFSHLAGYHTMSSFALAAVRAFRAPTVIDSSVALVEANELRRRVEELASDLKRLETALMDANVIQG
jgi:hypothetical protein